MSETERLTGAIIAAGEGSRLQRDGFTAPKLLVTVAGTPLIEGVVRNFEAAGITSLAIIVNERDRDGGDWVQRRFAGMTIELIVKTTTSSLESFLEVLGGPTRGRRLVSTVDAWCRPADFTRFAEAAQARPPESTVLAVTPFVADENPLWVDLDRNGRVLGVGGRNGAFVTAGLYLVPEHVRRMALPPDCARLRHFLAWLHGHGHPMYAEVIPTVIDVDRGEDVALAEAFERSGMAKSSGGVE